MFDRPTRVVACFAGAACAVVIAASGTAAAVDLDQVGLPVSAPPSPIDLGPIDPSRTPPAPPALRKAEALLSIPVPGAGGEGQTEPTDPCSQITGPAVIEAGAPVAAKCPITPPSDGGAAASPAGVPAAGETSTDVRGTAGTLPFTGSAIVWLLTIRTALAATGGALARVARRRLS